MTLHVITPAPATTTRHQPRRGRGLLAADLFDRLAYRIVTDDGLDHHLAERVLDQALAFLAACARNTAAPLAPSDLVDIGWHTFLLHTHDYAAFCQELAGRFLHHVPVDPNDKTATGRPARATLLRTVTAINDVGFVVDPELWVHADASDCTGCHNGCHDDPPPPAHR